MLRQKKQQVYKKRYSWAYSWTWRHNVALFESVAAVLPKARLGTDADRGEEKWMDDPMDVCMGT